MAIREIQIDQVKLHPQRGMHRRMLRNLDDLRQSIAEVGLLSPILVTDDLILIAGQHRLEACRALGWVTIPASVVAMSDLDAELAEIDENLIRHELHYTERGDLLARRKSLYEARHPETQAGVAGAKSRWNDATTESVAASPSFVSDTVAKAKRSATAIREDIRISVKAVPELKTALADADVPKAEALKAVRLPVASQRAVAERVQAGERPSDAIRAEKAAVPPTPRQASLEPVQIPARLETADARELPLEPEVVDLIVTSPPYGLDIAYDQHNDADDGWPDLMRDALAEMLRVSRRGGRLAINIPLDTTKPVGRPSYAETVRYAVEAGWTYKYSIVWLEDNISKSVARGSVDSPAAPHVIAPVEMIPVFYKDEWKRSGRTPDLTLDESLSHDEWLLWTNGLWRFAGESRAWEGHPAPFPLELPRRLIKLLSFPGDTILDPFMGSGSTIVEACKLGREAIGFDVSDTYVESTKRRLALSVGWRVA